jgi:hypothetical protein
MMLYAHVCAVAALTRISFAFGAAVVPRWWLVLAVLRRVTKIAGHDIVSYEYRRLGWSAPFKAVIK